MQKIRTMSTVALCVIVPFLLYYPWRALDWQVRMAFLEPERWLRSGWADSDAVIAPFTRVVYFAVWSPAVLAGVIGLLAGIRIAVLFRQGIVFDNRVAKAILWLGRATVASSTIHIFAACVSPMIVSWHNAAGALPVRFWYSSPHLSLVLCGLAFMLMGAVMREAIAIEEDNRKYV